MTEKEMEIEEENPDIFLDKEELESEKKQDEKGDIENSHLVLNDITNKKNNLLLIGTYGNGSALLKTCFYLEMKNQRNCYKTKFQYQGKDKKNKKIIVAELYQNENEKKELNKRIKDLEKNNYNKKKKIDEVEKDLRKTEKMKKKSNMINIIKY